MSERRISLIGGCLVAIGPISLALYTPAMPTLVAAFDTSEALVKLSLAVYFAGFAFTQLVCGPLSDGFGRKPVVLGFMMIYLIASLVALVAPSVDILIAARFFQGVGSAVGVASDAGSSSVPVLARYRAGLLVARVATCCQRRCPG